MKNLFKLNNKTALITGGGGLLGPKHAEALLEYGAEIILCDHNLEKVTKILKNLIRCLIIKNVYITIWMLLKKIRS